MAEDKKELNEIVYDLRVGAYTRDFYTYSYQREVLEEDFDFANVKGFSLFTFDGREK